MRTTTVGELKILLPDLDSDDLHGTVELVDDLVEASVEGSSWGGSRLAELRFHSSRLAGVDLSKSICASGTINGCEITRTDFSGATLSGLTIERCIITGSRFTGSKLTDVTLRNVLFEDCRFDYSNFHLVVAAGAVAFTDCTLAHAAWSSCRLPNIAMRSCQLADLELESCQLYGADLRGNRLAGLNAPLTNLDGIHLQEDQLADLAHLAVIGLGITVTH